MKTIITATFVNRSFQDSGRDQAPDYYIYEFTKIVDSNGKKYSDKWIKETKLMREVKFQKGKQYQITLSERPYSLDAVNLPYPVEVSWDGEKVYMKGGNSIIRVGKDSKETNLSVSINKIMGISNYDTAALNKFSKGLLTEDLLLKMNARGVYFFCHYSDPQDKRKSKQGGCGYTKDSSKGNYILIQKETEAEIKEDLKSIKSRYVLKPIEKYFKITTEILPPKKRK
jgi:hypothetical protein